VERDRHGREVRRRPRPAVRIAGVILVLALLLPILIGTIDLIGDAIG